MNMNTMKYVTRRLLLVPFLFALTSCDMSGGQSQTGDIAIETDQEDVRVLINEKDAGFAPLIERDLTPGRYLVEVGKNGFRTQRFNLNVIAGETARRTIELQPLETYLTVVTQPANALVLVNGNAKGQSPALIEDLSPGRHIVSTRVMGYDDKQVEVNLAAGGIHREVIDLISNAGSLVVQSSPSGASVFVDGRSEGTTPLSIDRIQKGSHEITLLLEGYAEYRGQVVVEPNSSARVDAMLTALPGSLKILSNPAGARIYLDDTAQGESPVTLDTIEPGTYRVRAELRGYETQNSTVVVGRGQTVVEEFSLESNSGVLVIITRPADVKVLVDGEHLGTTKARTGATDTISAPLTIKDISHGRHILQLVREGYEYDKTNFMITKDEVTALDETMKRQFVRNFLVRTGDGAQHATTGMLLQRNPDGSIVLETSPGIKRTFLPIEIKSTEVIKQEEDLN